MKKIMMILMVAALALPTVAQQQEWKSTSSLQGAGTYTAPITEVGATAVPSSATTTDAYSPAQSNGPRRVIGNNQDPGTTNDNSSPIGDAVLPLMLMALAFGGVIYLRRRKARA